MDWQALALTLQLAAATTAVLLILAIPLAWWIANSRGPLPALVQALVGLPLVLPPTVIGFYVLVGLGPLTLAGRLLGRLLGHTLAFSFAGLLAGSIVYSLPFAVQPLVAAFRAAGSRYVEAAAGLGVGPWTALRRVVLPLSSGALVSAAVLTFTHTVGEFGVVLMVGGNIPGLTRTLSIVLFDQVQDFHYAAAQRTALTLVVFSTLALLIIYGRWPERETSVA